MYSEYDDDFDTMSDGEEMELEAGYDGSEEETEEATHEGYYDNKTVLRDARQLVDLYPEVAEDLDELLEMANDKGWSLQKACAEKYGKMSAEDEAAYKFYVKKNPGMSRSDYIEKILNRDTYLQKLQEDLSTDAEFGRRLSENERKACDRLKKTQPDKNWTYQKYHKKLKELGL